MWFVTLGLLILGTIAFRGHARYIKSTGVDPNPTLQELSLESTTLSLTSLGHKTAMADLAFLQSLSEFGKHFGRIRDPDWMLGYLEAIHLLDEDFALPYRWAGMSAMYDGAIDQPGIVVSTQILEEGVEHFPNDWEMHMMLAVNYLFELEPETSEERARYQELGAQHLLTASLLPGAPEELLVSALSSVRRASALGVAHLPQFRQVAANSDDQSRRAAVRFQSIRSSPAILRAIFDRDCELLEWLESPTPSLSTGDVRVLLMVHPDPIYTMPEIPF